MGEISVNIGRVIESILPQAIMQCLEDACQEIENEAVDRCPSNDGQLRANMYHKVQEKDGVYIGTIGNNAEYAPFVHEGTGLYAKDGNGRKNVPWVYRSADGEFHSTEGQKPTQFLQKSLDNNMSNIIDKFEGCLRE